MRVIPRRQGLIPLKKFEPPPDTLVAVIGVDGQHMGVQVRAAARDAGQSHGKTDQAAGIALGLAPARRSIERTDHLAADLLPDR